MNILKCKVCGYLIKENKLGDICPACGVPKTNFEPHKENISQKRKFILDLNLHSIVVHFPQAFASILPLLFVFGIILSIPLGKDLLVTAKILSAILPFTVVAALIAGVIDAKTRFKKLSTPIIQKKIIIGSILFLLSIAVALLAFLNGIQSNENVYLLILLSIACIICEIILGELGKTIINAKMPG